MTLISPKCHGAGKLRKETQTDNQVRRGHTSSTSCHSLFKHFFTIYFFFGCLQYMAIPMVDQPPPQASLQASPRGSPSAPPSRKSTRRKTPPSQPSELPLPRDNKHLYGKIKEDRQRRGKAAEDKGGSVVYAALNHQPPVGAAARPRRPKEESSEYAAIRIPGH